MGEKSRSKGPVLRRLLEESGDQNCPVTIMTDKLELTSKVVGTGPERGIVAGQDMFAFRADSFREYIPDSDLWEFRIVEKDSKGNPVRMNVYMSGDDIFLVQVTSAIGL